MVNTNPCEISIGIDLGGTFVAITIRRGRKTTNVKLPGEGLELQSAVFVDEDGTTLVGKQARNAAYKAPERYYVCFKRGMVGAAEVPWNGGPTPIQLTAELLKHVWAVLLKTNPDIRDYISELGGTKPRDCLQIVVTHPATYQIDPQNANLKAAEMVGDGFRVDGQIAEPVAGSSTFRDECCDRLHEGDAVAVIDVGGATTDNCILRFNRTVFDVEVGGKGDGALGGINFTGRIYEHFCREVGFERSCFDPSCGLNPASDEVSDDDRRYHVALWDLAEEVKHQLSTIESATEFFEGRNGLKELTLTRGKFIELCEEGDSLWKQFDEAVADTIEDTSLDWSDVDHIVMIGGSAMLPGVVDRVAKVTDRQPQDVFLSSDSAHVVSSGAANQGYLQEEAAHCLPGGLGVRIFNEADGTWMNKFFFGSGEIIPPEGKVAEQLGQWVDSLGGQCSVAITLVETKPSVKAEQRNGAPVFLDNSDVVVLQTIHAQMELPNGRHEVQLGFDIDPNGKTHWRFTIPTLPQFEVVSGLVSYDSEHAFPSQSSLCYDVLILLDYSGSMRKDSKLVKAKEAIRGLLENIKGSENIRVALEEFGEDVALTCPFGTSRAEFASALQQIEAKGGTQMSVALELANEHLKGQPAEHQRTVILVTDGHPENCERSLEAANVLKEHAELVCVGIGEDAAGSFLQRMASTPDDYYYARSSWDIVDIFSQVPELYLQL